MCHGRLGREEPAVRAMCHDRAGRADAATAPTVAQQARNGSAAVSLTSPTSCYSMSMPHPRRKRKRTFNIVGHAHFVTYSCRHRLPLLSSDRSRGWVVDAVRTARAALHFKVWAYVIMPEHVHLLIYPPKSQKVETILAAIKRPVSRRAKTFLTSTRNAAWLERLSACNSSRSRFRFWQPGGGYDRNVDDEGEIEPVADYIHQNPVRRGLVATAAEWEWSSARAWNGQAFDPIGIDRFEL